MDFQWIEQASQSSAIKRALDQHYIFAYETPTHRMGMREVKEIYKQIQKETT